MAAAGDIDVFAVTKGCNGATQVARAMLEGGAAGLADSRLSSLKSLRRAFPDTPLLALRQPMRFEMAALAKLDAAIMISDISAAEALSAAASASDRLLTVLAMIEVGGGREGVPPESFCDFAKALSLLEKIQLGGIAANVGCRDGQSPGHESMKIFEKLYLDATERGLEIKTVSAGNSSCWTLLESGQIPNSANQMRFGEAILLGLNAADGSFIRQLHQDACVVEAEVLEVRPNNTGLPAIAAIGCQDTGCGELYPLDEQLTVTRLTSDHCVLAGDRGFNLSSGEIIQFRPSYYALQSLAASADVEQAYFGI